MRIIVVASDDKVVSKITGFFKKLPFRRYDKAHTLELIGIKPGQAALSRITTEYRMGIHSDLLIAAQDTEGLTGLDMGKELAALEIMPTTPKILYVPNPEKFLVANETAKEFTICWDLPSSFKSCEAMMEKLCKTLIEREVESRLVKVDGLMEKHGTEDFVATLENFYMHSARDVSLYKGYAPWFELPYLSLANIYIGANRHHEAIPYLKSALKINNMNHETHKNLALCYRKTGLSFEELEELKTTLHKFPHSSPTLIKVGEELLREGEYESAVKYFMQAVEFHRPADSYRLKARSHVGLGKAYMAVGDENHDPAKHEAARGEFDTAISIDPMLIAAYNNLIIVYNKLGMTREAQESMAKAVKLLPDDSDGWLNLFEIYLRDGEHRKALYALRKVTNSEPENQKILCMAAETYMRNDMFDEAIELFSKVLEINPSDVRIYNFMGICLRRIGDHEEAVSHYKKALHMDPGDCNIHFNLGWAHWSAMKPALAKKFFLTALELDPEFDEAKNALAMIAKHPDPDNDRRANIR